MWHAQYPIALSSKLFAIVRKFEMAHCILRVYRGRRYPYGFVCLILSWHDLFHSRFWYSSAWRLGALTSFSEFDQLMLNYSIFVLNWLCDWLTLLCWLRLLDRIYCLISLLHQLRMLCWYALIRISVSYRALAIYILRIIRVKSFCPYFCLDKLRWALIGLVICKAFYLLFWSLQSCYGLFLFRLKVLLWLLCQSIVGDIVLAFIVRFVSRQRHASILGPWLLAIW